MDVNELYEMRKYAYSLMNEVDPTSGILFPDDTIMKIPAIKKYNQLVCELLDTLIRATEKNGGMRKNRIPFFLTKSDIEKINYFDAPVAISEFCNYLNNHSLPGMRKLRASDLTKGLMKLGYLYDVVIDDEKSYKKPTEKGIELGITVEERKNSYGNIYSVNLYNEVAQKYIVMNLVEIIEKGRAN